MLTAYAKKIRNSDDPRIADDWRRIPRKDYKLASTNPLFRKKIREISTDEDEENSYYTGILNTIAEHCVGSVPLILGNHPSANVNDVVEDKWLDWAITNSIGTAIRQIRRGAARTGIGIGIPYKRTTPEDPVGFGIKTVSSLRLETPRGAGVEDRIYDGLEYDSNWDIIKIYLKEEGRTDPVPYDTKDILLWFKHTTEDMHIGMPECGPAFCLFPSIKRFMNAIVRGEEFKSCIPMAIKLDPDVYRPDDAIDVPTDKFEYEPGFVPTLPPGTDLTGLNFGSHSEDRTKFIYLVVAAAARCVQMPKNIALGDSSDSNMATAAIDIQPWINRVKIDRVDFQPIVRKVFSMWYNRATLISDYLPVAARNNFTYDINYDTTFEHPDPGKRATARATDLISGSTTLHKVYTDQGLNPRRQLDREARTLGITREALNEMIIAARVKATYPIQYDGATNE
jgi:hypothetical protein